MGKSSERILNAKLATLILLMYLAVEMFSEIFAGFIQSQIMAIVLNCLLGGGVMIYTANYLIPKSLRDTGPKGAAWVLGDSKIIIAGFIVGLIVDVIAHLTALSVKPHVSPGEINHVHYTMSQSGVQMWITSAVVVLLAPPVEEMLFRGLLYGGYRKSFGPFWAATLTTAIFVGVHYPSYARLPVNIFVFITLSLFALGFRLRSNAIGPAIAVHAGYNFMWMIFQNWK